MKDDRKIAEDLNKKITSTFLRYFLVKPLDLKKVKKTFTTPVTKEVSKKDGVEANDYDEVKTEVKEVDSDWREGVVIKVPAEYRKLIDNGTAPVIVPGDRVIYKDRAAQYFDLYKDSQLVAQFDIVAIENDNN